ncbi:two-component system response regulator [Xylanimonas oleitrophica]|uniref:Transcriptional regulatory protein n=1 Tax=Xylanimonas oleitrophica TaxID=2607479 RepID=A0A2W5WPS3_9MICO|nr:two-component system response regulator [Xylanimonas oleitrophica]
MRVLVVEDDPVVAELHRGYVATHPRFVVVGSAVTGTEALRLAATLRPDVVLLDVHLPDGDGLDVLTRLRTLPGPPLDVLATTAAREADAVRRAMAGGVVHYLVKPFTAAALRDRLDATWAAREALRRAGEAPALDQEQVDRLLARAAQPTPKGLSARSLELVEQALREAAGAGTGTGREGAAAGRGGAEAGRHGLGLSASEVAAAVGMSRVSARRYLEHLVTTGRARVAPRYGGTGRPENRYRPA